MPANQYPDRILRSACRVARQQLQERWSIELREFEINDRSELLVDFWSHSPSDRDSQRLLKEFCRKLGLRSGSEQTLDQLAYWRELILWELVRRAAKELWVFEQQLMDDAKIPASARNGF